MMLVEIEYYKENVLLYGKKRTYAEFRRQMEEIEAIYDEVEDNFVELLGRRYGWTVVRGDMSDEDMVPVYVYDRDTGKAYRVSGYTDEG